MAKKRFILPAYSKGLPFVHVNCSAIPPNLLKVNCLAMKSTRRLPGQLKMKPGKFEAAGAGTIYSWMKSAPIPIHLQSKPLNTFAGAVA